MVVIFEHENVKIKRKKAQPSQDFTTVGNRDNIIKLMAEDGKVHLKAFNPQTGLVYISSNIKSYANPGLNETNPKGVVSSLLNPTLTPDPRVYIFLFAEEGVASQFNELITLAAKAATEEDDSETIGGASVNSDYDATTNGHNSENDSVSSLDSNSDDDDWYEEFNATQDFNIGAQARAQEYLAGYK